jgi:hypothetical protein
MLMTLHAGTRLVTSKPVEVKEVAPGIGRIPCPECNGRPDEYPSLFPPEIGITQCVDCKGTGFVFVSI